MKKLNFDVVISGGGTAGAIAAISSARNGAKTLLIEKGGFLGGVAVTGFFPHTFYGVASGRKAVGGIPQEIIDRLIEMGGSLGHIRYDGHLYTHTPVDSELKRILLMQMADESGAQLMLETIVNDVVMEGGKLKSVIANNKYGTYEISAKTFIDSTGDGDVAFRCGAPFEMGRKDGKVQPVSLNMRITNVDMVKVAEKVPTDKSILWTDRPSGRKTPIYFVGRLGQWDDTDEAKELFTDKNHQMFCLCARENDIIVNISRLIGIDATVMEEAVNASVALRKQTFKIYQFLKKYVPGFEFSYLINESIIGVRETRRFKGDYQLTTEDVKEGRMFEDNIGLAAYPLDMHDPDGGNVTFSPIGGDGTYGIPFRTLLVQGVENLIVAGRCISATHEALASVRSIAACEVMGQAAGQAAAIAAKLGVDFRELDIKELQDSLVKVDVIL